MGSLKGMLGQNPVQTGTGILGMGMEMAFKKQAMDLDMKQKQMDMAFEKQKFDLLSSIQKAEENRNKINFQQQQTEIKNKEQMFSQMSKLLEGLFDEEGNVDKTTAQKIMALQANLTGKVNKTFVDLLQPKEEKPIEEKPIVVPPEASVFAGDKFLQAPGKAPSPVKPSYSHIKSTQGGLRDVEANKWILEPPKKNEPVTFEHVIKAMEALDELGMKNVYWEAPWLGKNKIKKQWLEDFIGGREVAPDLAASISRMFPETKIETAKSKATESQMKKAYELWKQSNTGTYEEFKAQLQ